MNISARTEYACAAVLELSLHYESDEKLRLRAIAEPHGIPVPFLVQILQQLKAAGIVASTRGAAGGYRLVADPSELTVGDVKAVIEGPARDEQNRTDAPSEVARTIRQVWGQLADAEQEILHSVTFADLAAEIRQPAPPMYYI